MRCSGKNQKKQAEGCKRNDLHRRLLCQFSNTRLSRHRKIGFKRLRCSKEVLSDMSEKPKKRSYKLSSEDLLAILRKEFESISGEVEGILLYGSHAKGVADKRSDLDICIIKPRGRDVLIRIFAKVDGRYDLKIFDDMPLYVKMGVMEGYKVIYGSEPEISYYLYGIRKKWEDMRHRIISNRFSTVSEMDMARRKWLETRRQIHVKT